MSEWNVINENFHTNQSVFTASDVYKRQNYDKKERERQNSNSKILFDKDCSLGSVKNLPNN